MTAFTSCWMEGCKMWKHEYVSYDTFLHCLIDSITDLLLVLATQQPHQVGRANVPVQNGHVTAG